MKKSKSKIYFEYGRFCGHDSQCICVDDDDDDDDGPVENVLCKIDRYPNFVENSWQFLHYYVDNEKIVHKLIKILTKRLIYPF